MKSRKKGKFFCKFHKLFLGPREMIMNKKTVKFIAGGALTGAANGLFGGGG